jgi:protein AroM
MKRKLGTITVGQSPRTDVVPEIADLFGDNVEIIETGALDDLSYEEILSLESNEDDYILVSRLRDGRSVKFAERHILPRLQHCIDTLEKKGADIILFICTGVFPDVFKSNTSLIYPYKIMHGLIPPLVGNGKLAVIIPDADQVEQCKVKWEKETTNNVIVVHASPYSKQNELSKAIELLKDTDADLIVMDCIGYNLQMKSMVAGGTGKKVVLARTMTARVLGEVLDS